MGLCFPKEENLSDDGGLDGVVCSQGSDANELTTSAPLGNDIATDTGKVGNDTEEADEDDDDEMDPEEEAAMEKWLNQYSSSNEGGESKPEEDPSPVDAPASANADVAIPDAGISAPVETEAVASGDKEETEAVAPGDKGEVASSNSPNGVSATNVTDSNNSSDIQDSGEAVPSSKTAEVASESEPALPKTTGRRASVAIGADGNKIWTCSRCDHSIHLGNLVSLRTLISAHI